MTRTAQAIANASTTADLDALAEAIKNASMAPKNRARYARLLKNRRAAVRRRAARAAK